MCAQVPMPSPFQPVHVCTSFLHLQDGLALSKDYQVGFRTGNPRVGFSHTVPIPANTLPVAGTTLTQPVNCAVSDETRGIHDTRGYFALKYCKYIMKYIKISK